MKAATHHGFAPTQHGSISIHAAREGGDKGILNLAYKLVISIHAAREGGDSVSAERLQQARHFNPRRP